MQRRAEVERLHVHIKRVDVRRGLTFGDLAQHYAEHELVECSESIRPKAHTTVKGYERVIRNRLLPKWANRIALGIEPLDVEQSLRALNCSDHTCARKISIPFIQAWPSFVNYGLQSALWKQEGRWFAQGGAASASVSAGATATYNLQITPTGYSGTASLSCRFQGTQPRGTACSVSPASVVLNGVDAATFTVSVATTARSTTASLALPSAPRARPSGYLASLFLFTLFMIVAVPLRSTGQDYARNRNRTAWAPAKVALFLALLCGLPGCGGRSTPPPAQTGTPAGTYNITLSAAAGGVTKTSTLTLIVN